MISLELVILMVAVMNCALTFLGFLILFKHIERTRK